MESLRAKAGPDSYENAFGFRWSDVQGEDEEHIANANFIVRFQIKLIWKFNNKITGGLFDYYGIVPKEKKSRKLRELISK